MLLLLLLMSVRDKTNFRKLLGEKENFEEEYQQHFFVGRTE